MSVPGGRHGKGKELRTPCHSQRIAHPGSCGKTRVVPQNLCAVGRTCGNQGFGWGFS